MRVAVRVDSSSAAESGMGLVSWCLGVGPVAGSENEVGGGKCGGRGRPKAAILFLDGAFGGNCGTAIGMGSGWTGDRLGAGPGSWRRRRREGSGGRCAVCGAGGPRFFLGFLGGGFGELNTRSNGGFLFFGGFGFFLVFFSSFFLVFLDFL